MAAQRARDFHIRKKFAKTSLQRHDQQRCAMTARKKGVPRGLVRCPSARAAPNLVMGLWTGCTRLQGKEIEEVIFD